ncbi:MAG: hypothetical protein IPG72_09940 [Ardenticatenales bacterium]|nr:hypothetical protein [Ardenticatenales bacterium]
MARSVAITALLACAIGAGDAPGFVLFERLTGGSPSSPTDGVSDNRVLALSPAAQAMPTVVDAEADTWVDYDIGRIGVQVSDRPHGAEPQLNLGMWHLGLVMDGLFRFGPPPAISDGRIERAELWLVVHSTESTSYRPEGSRKSASLAFSPTLDVWDETTVMGKDRPRHGAPEATAVATAGLLKLDFTAPAQAWLDGQRPNGWMVRAGSMAEGGTIQVSVWLGSRETEFAPKLVLFAEGDGGVGLTATPSAAPTATPTAHVSPRPSATTTGVVTPATSRSTAHLPWAGRAAALRGPD